MPTKNITLLEMLEDFASEDDCHEFLAELRWPDGVRCPKCNGESVSYLKKRRQYDCNKCRHRFSVRAGTIFNDSHLPLRKWFLAVYIITQSKKGISAKQLQRMLGVAYKTAWYLCHRIRRAMEDEDAKPLTGVVEIDETFVGGKNVGAGRGSKEGKDVVLAAVSRDGRVRLKSVPNRNAKTIHRFVEEHVSDDAEAAYTDAYGAYKPVLRRKGVVHGSVRHRPYRGKREWVNGKIHTNTVEGVFSLLDRSIIGAYHKVSTKHLPAYLHEVEWRYNNRSNPCLFRDTMLELVNAEPLEYKKLIA